MPLITELVAQHARERPNDRAVVEVGESGVVREWSFSELADTADRWATLLLELGVRPGEPVAYQLPNVLEFVAISLGALRIGAVCEPLMPIFREHELEFMLRESGARVLIVPAEFRGHDHATMAVGLRDLVPSIEHVLVLDQVELPVSALDASPPGQDETAQLLFTSGSTGEPKGVLQNHASLNLAAEMHIRHFGLTADDVIYIPSPLAHQTGFLYGMWIALLLGARQVLQTVWDAETGFEAMQSTGVTFVQAATPFLADLVRVAAERGQTLAALRTFVATGAAIPRELAREAREALGAEVGGAFGTTESCLGAAFVPGQDPELAWSADGRALEGITLRVVDDDGRELPPGEEGNFEVLAPTLFEGYLNRPELTRRGDHRGRLLPDRRPRPDRRRRVPADHRSRQGRDQPRRREGAGRRGRAAALRAPGGARGGDRGDARRAARRARLRVRRARARRASSTSRRCSATSTRTDCPSRTGRSGSRSSPSSRARRPARFRSSCCATASAA